MTLNGIKHAIHWSVTAHGLWWFDFIAPLFTLYSTDLYNCRCKNIIVKEQITQPKQNYLAISSLTYSTDPEGLSGSLPASNLPKLVKCWDWQQPAPPFSRKKETASLSNWVGVNWSGSRWVRYIAKMNGARAVTSIQVTPCNQYYLRCPGKLEPWNFRSARLSHRSFRAHAACAHTLYAGHPFLMSFSGLLGRNGNVSKPV